MTTAKVRVTPADLATFVTGLFVAKGMSDADARIMADVIVWADCRGVGSHGVSRVPMYLRTIDTGEMDPRAVLEIDDRAPALFVVEARRSGGPIAMRLALDEAMQRATEQGVAIGIARGTTHTGAIGRYVHEAAEHGFAAMHLNSGPPNMAYHGARVTSLATSPIAIGVPSLDGPLVLDMATATIANGRLQQAIAAGEPIPAGSALTKDGEPTTDARQADILLPLGGPKGSGLSFMFESLTSVLVAHPILMGMIGPGGRRRHVHNATLIVIDIAKLRPLAGFKADMSALGRVVKDLPRLDPAAEILLPGERAAREEAPRRHDGIPISSANWSKLCEAGAALGVPQPSLLS